MGRLYLSQLSGRFYRCKECQCHLACTEDLVSKGFQSQTGRAYLFDSVVNVTEGVLEEKLMITGLHVVADIYCNVCHQLLGWKYEKAYRKDQTYKENLFLSIPELNMEMDQTPQRTPMRHNLASS